jgi:signal peptidase I
MAVKGISRRRSWLAGLLNVQTPGLGNVYAGRPIRGLILYLFALFAGLLLLLTMTWAPRRLNVLAFLCGAVSVWVFLIIDGVQCAKAAKSDYALARYNRWYIYILIAVSLAFLNDALVGLYRAHVGQAARIQGPAMKPALLVGDHLMIDKSAYWFSSPKRGDIVSYQNVEDEVKYVTRIVGMPGETIEIRERVVFINGNPLEERYANFILPSGAQRDFRPQLVPANAYFCLGDNRDNSYDSRISGPIERARIFGKATMVYFSWDSENRSVRWDRLGHRLNHATVE